MTSHLLRGDGLLEFGQAALQFGGSLGGLGIGAGGVETVHLFGQGGDEGGHVLIKHAKGLAQAAYDALHKALAALGELLAGGVHGGSDRVQLLGSSRGIH